MRNKLIGTGYFWITLNCCLINVCAAQESHVIDSCLNAAAGFSMKINGAFTLASNKDAGDSRNLIFKTKTDALILKTWYNVDSNQASFLTDKKLSSLKNRTTLVSDCRVEIKPAYSDSIGTQLKVTGYTLFADQKQHSINCSSDVAHYLFVYVLIYHTGVKTFTEIEYYTPKEHPENLPEKLYKSITDSPQAAFTVLSDAEKVQIYDSLRVCGGYILWMGKSNCKIIDYSGQTLFSIPGNMAGILNRQASFVSHADGHIVMFDKNLDIIWEFKKNIHHELTVTANDDILFLSGETHQINNRDLRFDNIECYNSRGEKKFNWNMFDHRRYLIEYIMKDTNIFRYAIRGSSDPDSVLYSITPHFNKPELFHTNAIIELPENALEKKDSIFRKGNLLVSFCCFNDSLGSFIAIISPSNFQILWYYVQQDRKMMHTPSMLPNGNILLYMNTSNNKKDMSFIDEINPMTKKVVWSYTEDFPDAVRRNINGSCQRLPNGNTLISNVSGYIYEVTPEKEIVWQYFTNAGIQNEINCCLYRAYWIPTEKIKWLLDE